MKKKLIIVLGIHRSGTSAVARGIHALGCEFGDMLWPANVSNIKGFYENVEITNFNDELLHLLGVEWHSAVQIAREKFDNPVLAPFRRQAIDILNRHYGATPFFGFKCPRICRLLPFWQQVFSEMGVEESYVIVIRNPLSVAKSLDVRNGFAPEKSFLLWLVHILPAIKYTHGLPRAVIDYDIMMDNPIPELKRVAKALSIEINPAQESALNEFATSFLEENLRHTKFSLADMAVEIRLPKVVQEAYSLLFHIAKSDESFDDAFEKHWQKIEHAYQYDESIANLTDILSKCDRQIAELTEIVANRDEQISNLNQIVANCNEQISNLNQIIANRDEQISNLNQIATDREKQTLFCKFLSLLRLCNRRKEMGMKKDSS
jgi:hypothetical protein